MSETFEKIRVKDGRLGCIAPKVKSQVFKGGQNITWPTVQSYIRDHGESRLQRDRPELRDHH